MARDTNRSARLENQRIRQQEYRARLKRDRTPTHEDLARALLDLAITKYQATDRQDDLWRILDQVSARLLQVGFPVKETERVWLELEDRYEGGWSLLRQRCSHAELEAMRKAASVRD